MSESSDHRYDAAIGRRIQAIRLQRGLTQQGLAQRAHISYSAITKVESGHRAATPTLTAACARALRVPVTDLTGQPFFDSLRQDQLEELVQPVRAAVVNPMLPPEEGQRPRNPVALKDAIGVLEAARLRGDYLAVGVGLPPLVDELLTLIHESPQGHHLEQLYELLGVVYRFAHTFAYKFGFHDLALLALERADQAAQQATDPLLPSVVAEKRAIILLAHGSYRLGLREMARAESAVEEPARRGDARALSVQGSVHLKKAILHARSHTVSSTTEAVAHVEEARGIAGRIAGQPDPYGLVFDSWNVEIHSAAIQVDLGDLGAAVEQGERIHVPTGWAVSRIGHHHMDMARAYERLGRGEAALQSLTRAKFVAPVQTRYHPSTRETVLALLRRHRTPHRALSGYARWLGV